MVVGASCNPSICGAFDVSVHSWAGLVDQARSHVASPCDIGRDSPRPACRRQERQALVAIPATSSGSGPRAQVFSPPISVARGGAGQPRPWSKVRLLGQDQSVIDLDAEIANRALQLKMTK